MSKAMKITPNDPEKEKGIWKDYYGVKLLIARTRTTDLARAIRKKTKDTEISLSSNDPKSVRVVIEVMSESVLLDWQDFAVDGKKIAYTRERAIQLLTNDQDCRDFVSAVSMNIDNYLLEDYDKLVGE